jgi:predicted nucleotidyltransferase
VTAVTLVKFRETPQGLIWFALNDGRPLFAFAGTEQNGTQEPLRLRPFCKGYKSSTTLRSFTPDARGELRMDMQDEWLRGLRSWASGNGSVRELWLFGSRADGSSGPESDVDIAVALMPAVGDYDWALGNYFALYGDWKQELEAIVGRHVSLEAIVPDTPEDAEVRRRFYGPGIKSREGQEKIMIERLSRADRIDLARAKMERVLDHFLYVLELHANNSLVVYSPVVCTENLIRVDDLMESPKLAE